MSNNGKQSKHILIGVNNCVFPRPDPVPAHRRACARHPRHVHDVQGAQRAALRGIWPVLLNPPLRKDHGVREAAPLGHEVRMNTVEGWE